MKDEPEVVTNEDAFIKKEEVKNTQAKSFLFFG